MAGTPLVGRAVSPRPRSRPRPRRRLLQEFGFGLGFSVLVDALLIRSMLLPAVMHLIGPANWYLPTRLARILPRLDIEAARRALSEAGADGGR